MNRSYIVLASAVLVLFTGAYVIQRKKTMVDFDTSMRLSEYPDVLNNPDYAQAYQTFKDLYEKNYVTEVPADAPYKIPKILHHIWLGSPFPEKYVALRDTWLKNHPDWQYMLWTEKEIDEFGLTNRAMYDYAVNYGERSDIAKYEIIYRIGGVYIDVPDYECYKPLDDIHKAYDFYLGVQPLDTGHVQIGLGLFGARPGHPLLGKAIEMIHEKQKTIEPVVLRTGPFFFTVIFYHMAPKCTDKVIALPASFLYPMGYHEKQKDKDKWMRPEALANHLWAGSWLSADAFVKEK
jgi:mannosyltransferase OCH1-like enzyme